MIGPTELLSCRDVCVEFLDRQSDLDWSTPLPDVGLDIAGVCAHVVQATIWYAIDFAAAGEDLEAIVPEVKQDSAPQDLIRAWAVGADVLAAVIAASASGARGFHPWGQADASGFAAIACDEMLIHTLDISRGTGDSFVPPTELAAKVLARLFPWVEGDEDPWSLLQWANGRVALADRPRLDKWIWYCEPLDAWDGTVPAIPT